MDKVENSDFSGFNKDFSDRMFEKIRFDDLFTREEFIRDHEQFICMIVSKVTGKTVVEKNSDEYKIGISAFDYAINSFKGTSHDKFLHFCDEILTKWITAYISKNKNWVREEIVLLKNKMWEYGVSMEDLVRGSPDDRSTIASCVAYAKGLIETEPVFKDFSLKKELDVADVEKIKKAFSKKNGRYRKYIIAVSLIFLSELEDLKIYLENALSKNCIIEKIGIVLEYSMERVVFMTEHGRFIMTGSIKNYYIGQRIYINDKMGVKRNTIKYIFTAASVLAVVIIGYAGFDYFSSNIPNTQPDKPKQLNVLVNSSKEDSKSKVTQVKAEDHSEKSLKEGSLQADKTIIADNSPEPTFNTIGTQSTPVPTQVQKSIKGVKNSSIPKKNIKQTIKPKSSAEPVKASPGKITVNVAVPTGYPTVKATGIPAIPRITADNYELKVGQDYTIRMYIGGGNNGTKWVLYENGAVVSTVQNIDNTPNEQSAMRLFTAKKPGTYNYICELINSFGKSTSFDINIVVK